MKNSALKFVIPVTVVIVAAAAYFLVLKKPSKTHDKVRGEVYVLPKDFVVNLQDDKLAKVDVALVLAPGHAAPSGEAAANAPDGYGSLPQEALVRSIVTDELTDRSSSVLITQHGRDELESAIRKRILKTTDVDVSDVALTDIAVQ